MLIKNNFLILCLVIISLNLTGMKHKTKEELPYPKIATRQIYFMAPNHIIDVPTLSIKNRLKMIRQRMSSFLHNDEAQKQKFYSGHLLNAAQNYTVCLEKKSDKDTSIIYENIFHLQNLSKLIKHAVDKEYHIPGLATMETLYHKETKVLCLHLVTYDHYADLYTLHALLFNDLIAWLHVTLSNALDRCFDHCRYAAENADTPGFSETNRLAILYYYLREINNTLNALSLVPYIIPRAQRSLDEELKKSIASLRLFSSRIAKHLAKTTASSITTIEHLGHLEKNRISCTTLYKNLDQIVTNVFKKLRIVQYKMMLQHRAGKI